MLLQSCTSGSSKNLAFTLFDTVYRSAHACNLLRICKYGYRQPFIPDKRLGVEGYPFAQHVSVSQKRSPLSVLLAPLMLKITIISFFAVKANFKFVDPSTANC